MKKKIIFPFAIIAILAIIIIPLASCSPDGTTTTTSGNPLTELQTEVDELTTNFNTEIANLKTRISVVESSSATTLQSRIVALENDVATLKQQGNGVDCTEELQELADELLATNSSIDALRNEINGIKSDTEALEDNIENIAQEVSQINVVDYSEELEEIEFTIIEILDELQNYEEDITEIKADIVGIVNDIEINTNNISDLINELSSIKTRLNELSSIKTRLNALEATVNVAYVNPVIITGFNPSTETVNSSLVIKTKIAGDYAIIITLYGTNLMDLTDDVQIFSETVIDQYVTYYGASDGSMMVIILEPTDTPPVAPATTPTENNWAANKTITLLFSNSKITESNVQYATVTTGVR